MSTEVLLEAFRKAGVLADDSAVKGEPITKADLMDMGLIGAENSAQLRRELQRSLGLPELLSANLLIEVLNVLYSRDEFMDKIIQKGED